MPGTQETSAFSFWKAGFLVCHGSKPECGAPSPSVRWGARRGSEAFWDKSKVGSQAFPGVHPPSPTLGLSCASLGSWKCHPVSLIQRLTL